MRGVDSDGVVEDGVTDLTALATVAAKSAKGASAWADLDGVEAGPPAVAENGDVVGVDAGNPNGVEGDEVLPNANTASGVVCG